MKYLINQNKHLRVNRKKIHTIKSCWLFMVIMLLLIMKPNGYVIAQQEKEMQKIKWVQTDTLNKNLPKGDKIYLVFLYTDWCKWCKRFEKEVLDNSVVSNRINEFYYPVKINAESKTTIYLNNQSFEYDPIAKVNLITTALLDSDISYPSTVILDKNYEIIQKIQGYIKLEEFIKIISSINN